ncbi:hypothetical protein [Kribbella catacumbae]|uniref:hypothetical protein n=1 Tax=Kribbella catacumbae TaxID=460086 RepID=UPI000375524E|nr:hypothetical protein [Kribbella catacumbae]
MTRTSASSSRVLPRREQLGAWFLLTGTALSGLGLVWDVQWHSDVGPDTFFTAPHLVMYLGGALSGITSLIVVLLGTRAAQRPQYVDGAPALTVLGTFRAPLPFLVCGTAGAIGLLYGLTDLWWHEVFGFDVTPTSPPHVAMALMSLFDTFGLVMAFVMLRSSQAGRIGLICSAAVALPNLLFLSYSTPPIRGINMFVLALVAFGVLLVTAVAGALRRPSAVAWIALSTSAVTAVMWYFGPVATNVYADALGLGMRDYAAGYPAMAITMPFALPVAALVLAVGFRYAAARNYRPQVVLPALGAAAGVLVALGYVLIPVLDTPPATLAPAALVGALAAWIGWQLGSLGREISADVTLPSGTSAPQPTPHLLGTEV